MFAKDLGYAFRTLRNSPIFSLTAVLTIALGIGASTAIFSVANAVLLRPLPYKDPDRLLLVCNDLTRRNVRDFPISNADFLDIRSGAKSNFESFAAVATFRALVLDREGQPEQVRGAAVSINFLPLMGTGVIAGRDFQESDGVAPPPPANPNAQPAAPPQLPNFAILSQEYFQRRFGGDTSILGKALPVADGQGAIVVGVAAPNLELHFPPQSNVERNPDVWFAARIPYDVANRNNVLWRVIGRMKPGTTLQQAQAEMERVNQQLQSADPIAKTAGQHLRLEPMKQHLLNEVQPAILALTGAVLFLLLIACANVANLMLVRSAARERELAVRTALGGSWWRLVRQTLAEALVIAGAGALLGVFLASFALDRLLAIAPPTLPRLESVNIDLNVLAFSIVAALLSAALFGIVPAMRAAKPDINSILRASGRNAGLGGGGLLRDGVVVLEVALSFVLLIGSGLLFRSFLAVQRVDLGFDATHLLTFRLLGNTGETPQARDAFLRQVHNKLSAIPGVQGVTAAFPFPLAAPFGPIRWGTEEALTDETKFRAADLQIILPGYFETMKTPLLEGRTFTQADNVPGRNLIVIDRMLAAKAFGKTPAVGKRILYRTRTPKAVWGEVIGVVAHQRHMSLNDPGREQIFVPDGHFDHGVVGWWAVRSSGNASALAAPIRDEIRNLGGRFLVNEIQPMDTLVRRAQAGTRFALLLLGAFSLVAAVLAAVGLYGVLSTLVRQRTAEIGVRVALGAAPSKVFGLVVGHGLRLSIVGIGIGLIAAAVFTRGMQTMLVGVAPTDPMTFTGIAALFFTIALLACWIPARRAAALDPINALRQD